MHKLSGLVSLKHMSRRHLLMVAGTVFAVAGLSTWAITTANQSANTTGGTTATGTPSSLETLAGTEGTAGPGGESSSTDSKVLADTTDIERPTEEDEQRIKDAAAAVAARTQSFWFGVGTELNHDLTHRITQEAPVKIMSSWYNGPGDLGFMSGWRTTLVPQATNAGKVLHLIVYSNDAEKTISTPYGTACGRPYPVSARLVDDMRQLATIYKGSKLYVSMFTELQTYPCQDNNYKGSENYYKALKANYRAAVDVFHEYAPGSKVSLTWGGWLTNWDDPTNGGGRSLLNYFQDELNMSDFQSFQAMANHSNVSILTDMTAALKPYPGKTMVAHYKPDHASQAIFNDDMNKIFTPMNITNLKANELFAFSFMDTVNMNSSEAVYQKVKNIVQTYAR